MSERLKGVPLSHEVLGGHIAHQVAFQEGEIVFDSTELARERFESRLRNLEPNGYIEQIPGTRNDVLFGAIEKADATRLKAPALSNRPRGYSEGYWHMQQKQAKKLNTKR